MKHAIAGLATLAIFTAFACSSGSGDSNGGSTRAQGNANPYVTGCTRAPACGSCATCIEGCYCATGDIASCANTCTPAAGNPPPGATNPPPGGTANPPPVNTGPTPTSVPTSPPPGTVAPPPTGTVAPPPTGTVAPPPTGTVAPPPTATTPPPPPANEFTLTTVPFDLPPGGEQFKCQNFTNPLGKDIAIIRASSFMSPGSHHMYVFDDPNFNQNTNAVADCSGTEFHDYLILAQTPQEIQTYPAGLGRSLPGGYGLRVLMHYLNSGSSVMTAQVTAKFLWVDPGQVQHLAAQMELNNALLNVPPGVSTQSRTFTVPYGISIIYAISHMHRRATRFRATTNTNQVIFDGTTWDEPQPVLYDPPLSVAGNSVITWSCDYNNDTGQTLQFGDSAIKNEMCILFTLFYATDPGSPQGKPLDQVI